MRGVKTPAARATCLITFCNRGQRGIRTSPCARRSDRAAWHDLLGRTLRASTTDRVSLAAAGCAFYATLALFPAISMLISVCGMVLDRATAEQQLVALSGLLPPPAFSLIEDRVHQLAAQSSGNLSLHLACQFSADVLEQRHRQQVSAVRRERRL